MVPVELPRSYSSPVKVTCFKVYKRKLRRASVSFAGDDVRSFTPDSIVQARPCSGTEKVYLDLSDIELCSDAKKLRMSMNETFRNRWLNPRFLGSTTRYWDSRSRKTMLKLTSSFLVESIENRDFTMGIIITKRGYALAEILCNGPRDLSHTSYTNSILQTLYNSLTPSLRAKTDKEWLRNRMRRRQKVMCKCTPSTRLSKQASGLPKIKII
mmetsp:Transcript_19605/g.27366  ORF Transcript_19605/g.27366 Transcript_19605/m.27366 type:complete len:212 (+) Transcript_19605:84-719(+)|eukprot:CAMPEP_0184481586 /NCGR_PEP_ID=MMETSP0113_2-20130426/3144_1 /TAXON_ID=91329 /ORGANISM="Norrisiella sphaerica, Strain BC52" /LENGTH=211 /DNA_ID=CAMNT_0026860801 /DNA_START=50 /DNA_END=685 /DNA_ORIENTATION=+